MVVVIDVVAVVVVVAAAGGSLLCSAAAAATAVVGGGSAAAGGHLGSAAAAVIVAAGGSSGGSSLLPPAAGDGELRFGARACTAVAALDGSLGGAVAGLTDDSLHKETETLVSLITISATYSIDTINNTAILLNNSYIFSVLVLYWTWLWWVRSRTSLMSRPSHSCLEMQKNCNANNSQIKLTVFYKLNYNINTKTRS